MAHDLKEGHSTMTTSQPTDVETTVKALLDAAKLQVSEEEFQLFVRIYRPMRAGADGLYIPETRNEDPALIFNPAWTAETLSPGHRS